MVNISRMTERQVTKAFFAGEITRKQYTNRLVQIATARHIKIQAKKIIGRKPRKRRKK